MTLISKITQASFELSKWDQIPKEQRGRKIASLSELKKIFPENQMYSQINLMKGFGGCKIYLQENKYAEVDGSKIGGFERYLAYDCPNCGIVVGPPKIDDLNNIPHEPSLFEKEGYSSRCINCGVQLGEVTLKSSF